MIRRPPRSTLSSSSAASDVYKRQVLTGRDACERLALGRPRDGEDDQAGPGDGSQGEGDPVVGIGGVRVAAGRHQHVGIGELQGSGAGEERGAVPLGLGPDGHCASLFPGSAALELADPDVLVAASRDPNAANPHDRITLTLAAIARARLVVFTVSGTSKHQAFARIAAGEDLPAARITADRVLWLVDTAAAGDVDLFQPRSVAQPAPG